MIRDWFPQKRKYAIIPSPNAQHDIPDGLVNKCPQCGHIHFSEQLQKNLHVCTACGYHLKIGPWERLAITVDEGSFVEFDATMTSEDPLHFPGYAQKLSQQKEKTQLQDAVISGEGTIGGIDVVVSVLTFSFFSGSMGSVVGEKITRAIERATYTRKPLVIFSASGGARMQESILSLMQMAKTAAALQRHHAAGLLYISVFTDPTLGGVSASFAMLGDIILAEPGAIVGFAGRIVIEQTIREQLPRDFQTAEFNLAHGQLDRVVPRSQMRPFLQQILALHEAPRGGDEDAL